MEQAAIPTTAADAVNKPGIEAPIGAPPARRKHSRHRYLRFTRRARRLSLIVTGLFGLGLRLSGAGVGIIFVILLGLEHFCVRWDRIRHWRDNSGTRWAEPGRGAGRRFAIEPLWCARPPCAVAL